MSTARNGLESYAYNLRNSLNDEQLETKFAAEHRSKLEAAFKWLDGNPGRLRGRVRQPPEGARVRRQPHNVQAVLAGVQMPKYSTKTPGRH